MDCHCFVWWARFSDVAAGYRVDGRICGCFQGIRSARNEWAGETLTYHRMCTRRFDGLGECRRNKTPYADGVRYLRRGCVMGVTWVWIIPRIAIF